MAAPARPRLPTAIATALLGLSCGACFDHYEPSPAEPTSSGDGTSTAGSTTTPAPATGHGGTEPTTTAPDSSDASGTTDAMADGSTTGAPVHQPCPAGSIEGPLPVTLDVDTSAQLDELAGTCGGSSAPELTFTFTAPAAGEYVFDTGGSEVDTVLYLLAGVCDGPELRCDDDGLAGSNASVTSLELDAGETITVVLDAFGVSGGPARLTVSEGTTACPAQVVPPGLPQTVLGQTIVATDLFEPSCGTEDEGDQAIAFTAPYTGIYRFDTAGSDFDTTLTLLDGTCGGPELACNDDEPGALDGSSGLALPLHGGQAVTAVVEGFFGESGTFALNVDRLAGACPDQSLGSMAVPFVVTGSTASADEATASSCGGLGSPDYSYVWTPPADAVYRFDTAGSSFDTVVALFEDDCFGPELACNDDAGGTAAATSAYLQAGQPVIIVVDGNDGSGDFTLLVEETTDSGDCCTGHMAPGCEHAPIQVCVCTLDAFCCNTSWDDTCASTAVASCGAVCL